MSNGMIRMDGSEVALDSVASQLHILSGIQVHIKLNLAFKSIQLFFSLTHAADDHNRRDDN